MEFASAFMGNVGFDELKKHCRLGDDFSREVLAVMSERAACELAYAKSLKRLSHRLSKACSSLMGSPLSTLWRTIGVQIEGDAESHRKFSAALSEECVKTSAPIIDTMSRARKNLEASVDSTAKIMSDKLLEHSKLKKRHHQLSKEREAIRDQLEGARPKTKSDESKLAQKQSKTEVLFTRADDEYYEALIELQRRQTDWELCSKNACIKIQEMERNKTNQLCQIAMLYSSLISNVSQQLSTSCEQIQKHSSSLDPDGEIRIVVQNKKTAKYQTELILCDYFGENFTNVIKAERRISSLTRPLEKFLGDLQKERTHYDGMRRLVGAQSQHASEDEEKELHGKLTGIVAMMTFLDVNRVKLQKAIATVNGKSVEPHPLASSIEQHYDKQGIMHSTLKVPMPQSSDSNGVFGNSSNASQRHILQRSQSERVSSVDDIGIGRARQASDGFDKRGTLTAKQLQSLYGVSGSRKVAPAPPIQSNRVPRTPSPSTCRAKYRYDSRQHDELTIDEGDVIKIHENSDKDWWKGELNGRVGIFPATYVDMI